MSLLEVPAEFSLLPLQNGELFGSYATAMLARYPGSIKGVLVAWEKLVRSPITPRGLRPALEPFARELPDPVAMALNHTDLWARTLPLSSTQAALMARDTLEGGHSLMAWAVAASRDEASIRATPKVCLECLAAQSEDAGRTYFRVRDTLVGYDMCAAHERMMFDPCAQCAAAPWWEHYATPPDTRCRCGAKRVARRLRGPHAETLGLCQDFEQLLAGALDPYTDVELLQTLQRRAITLNLYGTHDAEGLKAFLADHVVAAHRAAGWGLISYEALGYVVQGRKLHSQPAVNLICFRAAFGSLSAFVAALQAEHPEATVAQPGGLPHYLAPTAADPDMVALVRAVIGGILARKRYGQHELRRAWMEVFDQEVLDDEPWLRRRIEDDWESTGKPVAALRYADAQLADVLRERVAALSADPFHPRRTRTNLLKGILPRNTYGPHQHHFPLLAKVLAQVCESHEAFHRRLYLGIVRAQPERLLPAMPRNAAYIKTLPDDRLRDLLRFVGVKLVGGRVRSGL